MKQTPSSSSTYQHLVDTLWKDFVDKSLFTILWFDHTLDTAETISDKQDKTSQYTHQLSQEVQWVLSDMDNALVFSREKFHQASEDRKSRYFGFLQDNSSIEDFNLMLTIMMDEINNTLSTKSLHELYFDYYFLLELPSLKFEYPLVFNHEFEQIGMYGYPHGSMKWYITDKDFQNKFLIFMQWFYDKISSASQNDLIQIFVMSEFFRQQSGQREGIGNAMNPMIQISSIEELLGSNKTKDIQWRLSQLLFTIKKQIPGTTPHKRHLIENIAKNLNRHYFFPSHLLHS